MTLWRALKSTYAGSVAFIGACTLLALVPVVFELLQHVVEVRLGMYDSLAAFEASGTDPWRLGFGLVKVVSLTVPNYWITRYLATRDRSFATSVDPSAIRLFVRYLAFQFAMQAIQLLLVPQAGWAQFASLFVGHVIGCLVLAWAVAAALGNASVGLRGSVAIMGRRLPWTFVFVLVAVLPLMIPHYAFATLAIGAKTWLWPALVVDALLVGWLAAVIVAAGYFAATRAAAASGVSLAPVRA